MGEVNFFGMGTDPNVCFLDGGRRSLVVFQSRKVGFCVLLILNFFAKGANIFEFKLLGV